MSSSNALSFIHTSDWHLECPAGGIPEVPQGLRELFIEAPYLAAERVIETALEHSVDFVALAGDIVDPRLAGPRAWIFLQEQFARLADRDIEVYWAGGNIDHPDAWPEQLALPDNVTVFPIDEPAYLTRSRGHEPVAEIIGQSRRRRKAIEVEAFHRRQTELPTIVIGHTSCESEALEQESIDYWALGSKHRRATLFASRKIGHYSGSPQGRSPREQGAHGCTLVTTDDEGILHTSFVPCDVLRWQSERLVVDEATTKTDMEQMLGERMRSLVAAAGDLDTVVSWSISGSGSIISHLRRPAANTELLSTLRKQYGEGSPTVWTANLDVDTTGTLDSTWYEQDSILGDFLRALRDRQADKEPLDLTEFVGDGPLREHLGSAALIDNDEQRRHVLQHVGALGAELLRGEDGSP